MQRQAMSSKKTIKRLKQIQADSHAMFIKLHSYNWNIEGMNFMAVQNMTEQLHDYMARLFNDSAEHIIQLDDKPHITISELDKNRQIKDDTVLSVDYKYVAKSVIRDLNQLKKDFEELEKLSEGNETLLGFSHDNIGFILKEIAAIECL